MLLAAGRAAGVPVQVVRLGQTCGGRGGHWNETEWFPVIVKSALEAGCLPDVDGVSLRARFGFVLRFGVLWQRTGRGVVEFRTQSPELRCVVCAGPSLPPSRTV